MTSLQRDEKRVHIRKAIAKRKNSTAIQVDLDYPDDRLFNPSQVFEYQAISYSSSTAYN
ncbi:MAG: hypothetical protein RMZ41_030280 [Nostoc sp. DedVER02]|uniref:hypothetical protein n=1 Tax=unclassified Nostoc TaxID=2593658 RepID=UPI002AD295AA|nr:MULTISPECIES: hypothetical protein [unclassified Nostoc]MDZ7987571.1 hypothetical protein [Nostoc sp. DedVER02]MDZ8116344.1 hypothetical protein [Nostoc sp. DedVER01b]